MTEKADTPCLSSWEERCMKRSSILLTVISSTFSSLGVALLGPVYTIFVINRFSASIIDVGILSAIFSLVAAIFKVPAGRLTDLYGKEKIFLIGIIAGTLFTLLYCCLKSSATLFHRVFLWAICSSSTSSSPRFNNRYER